MKNCKLYNGKFESKPAKTFPRTKEAPSEWILLKIPYWNMTSYYFDPNTKRMYCIDNVCGEFDRHKCEEFQIMHTDMIIVEHHNSYDDTVKIQPF